MVAIFDCLRGIPAKVIRGHTSASAGVGHGKIGLDGLLIAFQGITWYLVQSTSCSDGYMDRAWLCIIE